MNEPTSAEKELFLVGQLAAAISIASFFYYLRKDDLLLYGDAVAHINIARRVFDSKTPGLLQLGTVWLPLPHLLMLPFLLPRWLWQSGIGGSIPSLFAFVLSVIGIFLLAQELFVAAAGDDRSGVRVASWFAAGIFALNPNLIYLQTSAMTESLYVAFFVWTVVYFCRALLTCRAGDAPAANSSLTKAGLCVLGACLTRYDGWLLAALMIMVLLVLAYVGRFGDLRIGTKKFLLLAAAGPALWIAYNAAVYRNPLEFANGPYSAKAIEQRTLVPGYPPHPGTNDLRVAFRYFFKSAELNMTPGHWQIFWVCALLLGTTIVVLFQKRLWPLLFLWIPVPFYMLSIAYSGVPLFVPVWWPFSYYNVRYGIEMLPAFALFTAAGAYGLIRFAASKRARVVIPTVFLLLAGTTYALNFRKGAVSLEEAMVNSRSRIGLENVLTTNLLFLPPHSTFLAYVGDHVGAFERAGIPLANVINEGNHRPWMRPTDPDGLWERALADPAKYVNYVIASESDPVVKNVNKNELTAITVLHVSGQPQVTIYRTSKQ